MIRKHPHQIGFTLVEMAIVLAILGIILGGLFAGTSALRETSKFKEDQQKLQDIKAALLSYVAVNHYLPCPDTSGDGIENPNDFSQAQCNATSGNLPHLSLGTHAVNAYGLPFSYYINTSSNQANSVTDPGSSASYFGRMNCNPNTTNQTSAPCFNKDTPPTSASPGMGNFNISNGTSNIAINIPLVVISHGQNGCNGVTGGEADNCTSNAATYYQAPQNREGPNAFDDVLIWLSSLEIKHAAGLLSGSSEYTHGDNSDPTDQTLPDNYAGFPTAPTETELNDPNQFTQIDGTDADQTSGINDGKTEASVDDNIYITGDATQDLNLVNGNDTIYIKGDLDSKLSGNQQTKKVYIEGKITDRGEISLIGNQENYVQVFQSNEGKIYINGNGDNQVIIYGDLALGSTIQMLQGSTNSLYIGGNVQGNTGLRASVTGTIYLNKTATELGTDLNRTLDRLDATTILCRASTGSSSFIACN